MARLTKGRGWSEEFVRWQLPPWRGLQYLHVDLLQEGEDVIWADREQDPQVVAFRAVRDQIRAKYGRPGLTMGKGHDGE